MARKKAGEQTNPQAAVVQDGAQLQTAGSVRHAQVPKEASQDEKSQETQAQQKVAVEAKTDTEPVAAPAPPPTPADAPAPRLALRITAKPRNGFRRCGLHHPAAAVDHPEGRFSAAEIALLKAEPNLVVEDL
jgi:hypothetical protein